MMMVVSVRRLLNVVTLVRIYRSMGAVRVLVLLTVRWRRGSVVQISITQTVLRGDYRGRGTILVQNTRRRRVEALWRRTGRCGWLWRQEALRGRGRVRWDRSLREVVCWSEFRRSWHRHVSPDGHGLMMMMISLTRAHVVGVWVRLAVSSVHAHVHHHHPRGVEANTSIGHLLPGYQRVLRCAHSFTEEGREQFAEKGAFQRLAYISTNGYHVDFHLHFSISTMLDNCVMINGKL